VDPKLNFVNRKVGSFNQSEGSTVLNLAFSKLCERSESNLFCIEAFHCTHCAGFVAVLTLSTDVEGDGKWTNNLLCE